MLLNLGRDGYICVWSKNEENGLWIISPLIFLKWWRFRNHWKLCGWERCLEMAVSVGRGTDGYTGFGRHCLRGAKCNTFKPCLWENLDETDMSLFKAIWLFDVFCEWDSKQDLHHEISWSFRLQLKCGHIQLSNIKPNHTWVYHIFSGLWFGFWSGYRPAELHNSINEVTFPMINISQDCINIYRHSE